LNAKVTGVWVIRDSLVSIAAEVILSAASLTTGIVLARAVGAEGKGVFTLVMTVATAAAAMLGLRWDRPAGHFLAKDMKALPAIITSVAVMAGTASGLAALLIALAPSGVALVFRGVDPSVASLVGWLVGAQCLYVGIAAIYGGLRDFGGRSRFMMVYNIAQTASVCGLSLLGGHDVVGYLRWCAAVSWTVEAVWLTMLAWRRRVRPRWDGALLRRMVAFGSLSYFSLLLDLITLRLDVVLLNYMASTAAVGVYSVAVAIGGRLQTIPQTVAYVVFYRTSARELGTGARTAQILRIAGVAVSGVSLVVGAIGSALVVPLFGPQFALAVPAMWIMIPAMAVFGLYRLLASDVEGRGRPGLISVSSLLANVTIVGLDLLWIPRFGILGAAWASLIAYGVALAMAAVMFCRVTGLGFREAYWYRADDLGAMTRILAQVFRRRPELASQLG
jgi:O-antigen/teichoic acid export membrane protein